MLIFGHLKRTETSKFMCFELSVYSLSVDLLLFHQICHWSTKKYSLNDKASAWLFMEYTTFDFVDKQSGSGSNKYCFIMNQTHRKIISTKSQMTPLIWNSLLNFKKIRIILIQLYAYQILDSLFSENNLKYFYLHGGKKHRIID